VKSVDQFVAGRVKIIIERKGQRTDPYSPHLYVDGTMVTCRIQKYGFGAS